MNQDVQTHTTTVCVWKQTCKKKRVDVEKDIQKKRKVCMHMNRDVHTHTRTVYVWKPFSKKKLAHVEKDLHEEKDIQKICVYGFYSHTSMHTHLCICGKDF